MKVNFDSQGNNYVEMRVGPMGHYQLIISAQDPKNPLTTIVNSVELTADNLSTLISDLGLSLDNIDNKG